MTCTTRCSLLALSGVPTSVLNTRAWSQSLIYHLDAWACVALNGPYHRQLLCRTRPRRTRTLELTSISRVVIALRSQRALAYWSVFASDSLRERERSLYRSRNASTWIQLRSKMPLDEKKTQHQSDIARFGRSSVARAPLIIIINPPLRCRKAICFPFWVWI